MAEQNPITQPPAVAPPTTTQTPSDAYDLDPQAFAPEVPTAGPSSEATAPAPATPATETGPAPSTLDRGPDGRFLPRTNRHPPALAEMASDYGMSPEDIAATDTDSLALTVRYLQRARGREQSIERTMHAGRDTPGAAEPGDPGAANPVAPAAADDDLGLSPEDWDARIIGAFSKLQARIASLEKKLDEAHRYVQSQAAREAFSEIDKGFADLGQGYEYLVGKGAGADMAPDSGTMKTRMLVVKSLQDSPIKNLTVRQATKKRAQELLGHLVTKTVPATPPVEPSSGPTREEWDRGGLAVPTHRTGSPEPEGRDKAIRSVSAKVGELRNGAAPASAALDEFPE